MKEKRITILIVLVVMMLASVLSACANTSNTTEKTSIEELNDDAKQAYSEVLSQYEDAAALTWEEYNQKKDEYPLVCSQAMSNYAGSGQLYYAYYDLNGDGLDELLIGSDWDVQGYDPVTSDVFVYCDGQMFSVLDSRFKNTDESMTVYDPVVYRNNVICAGITTDESNNEEYSEEQLESIGYIPGVKEETWFFKLDEEGKVLETVDYIKAENGKFYQGEQEITEQEYKQLRDQLDDYDPNFEGHEEEDVPFEVLIG